MKTYLIVIAKKNKKIPDVESYLKDMFDYTWKLRVTKDGETWLGTRKLDINVRDTIAAIKNLNKRIEGVMIQNIVITEAGYDNGGVFDTPTKGSNPSSKDMLDIMIKG